MSRVDILKKSRDLLSVKFLEFTRVVKNKDRVAVFFEGEDEKYYSVRIDTLRPDIAWTGINCNGKKNVISLREKIRTHPNYKSSLCLFFVDSDFDDNSKISSKSDIYVTPCYSIENLYFSDTVFRKVLAAEFGLSETAQESDCFKKVIGLFEKLKSEYLDSIKGFNILLRQVRVMEKSGDIGFKLNVNNISIDDLVNISLDGVQKIYDENLPKSVFKQIPEDVIINCQESIEYFSNTNEELSFRGKQHLEFLRIVLCKLKEDRGRKKNRKLFLNKGNVKIQLTKGNCVSELSQYAHTPSCLQKFLLSKHFSQAA